MRRLLVALCLLGFASHASAQDFDMPTLRGSSPFIPATPKYTRWAGVYAGGQVGYSLAHMDLGRAFADVNIFTSMNPTYSALGPVSRWASFQEGDHHAASYGGFAGYNAQWADVILGAEVNYNHTSLRASSNAHCSSSIAVCPQPIQLGSPAFSYSAAIDATATARITDYGTFRGRGGWVYGNMLAYGLFGVAVGRVEVTRTATASFTPVNPAAPGQLPHTETDQLTRYAWGYTLGGGVDFLLASNVFLRAEYEFVWLNPVANVDLSINTARVGVGYKF
jgi:outer membrane immunogenic protein